MAFSGVIGALFDLEAEKEGQKVEPALGVNWTRLTAKALMYLVLTTGPKNSSNQSTSGMYISASGCSNSCNFTSYFFNFTVKQKVARIHNSQHNQKICTLFKLIQPSNMVTLSCLAKKNQNLNPRKKSSVYYWKWRFPKVCGMKTQLSLMNWTFFPRVQILIFLRRATQGNHIRMMTVLVWTVYKFFWLCWELWICATSC